MGRHSRLLLKHEDEGDKTLLIPFPSLLLLHSHLFVMSTAASLSRGNRSVALIASVCPPLALPLYPVLASPLAAWS